MTLKSYWIWLILILTIRENRIIALKYILYGSIFKLFKNCTNKINTCVIIFILSCYYLDHCAIYSTCQNDGYLKRVGGLCYCECVDGLSGRDCTDVFTCPGKFG